MSFCTHCGTKLDASNKFCTGCGAAVATLTNTENAVVPQAPAAGFGTCKECGATYSKGLRSCPNCGAGTVSLKDAYLSTDLKKGGFGLFDLLPGLRDLPTIAKVLLLIVLIGGGTGLVWLGIGLTRPSKAIELVKTGHFTSHPEKTVGEAIDGFFGSPKWSSGVGTDGETQGKTLVNVRGSISYEGKPVEALIQFVVNTDSGAFELRALEFNGIPQNKFMIAALINKMYE